jgi:MFS family permease
MLDLRNARAIGWVNLFVSALQVGWGAFIAVYLTDRGWTQSNIGFALSFSTAATIVSQAPAGWLIDRTDDKRLPIAASLVLLTLAAIAMAIWPSWTVVLVVLVTHGVGSCLLGPAIVAATLELTGSDAFAARIGINARWQSFGTAGAALLMGAAGNLIGKSGPLIMTAILAAPALIATLYVHPRAGLTHPIDEALAHAGGPAEVSLPTRRGISSTRSVWSAGLFVFAGCAALFTLSNAAMLTLALDNVAERISHASPLITAASVVVPQAVIALAAPWLGLEAQRRGRKIILLLGFLALPLRGLAFALLPVAAPTIIMSQFLDGVSGAVFGIAVPLIAADLTRKSGGLNLAMSVIGVAIGIGATASTLLAGLLATYQGFTHGLLFLTAAGAAACLLVAFAMPETRPGSPVRRKKRRTRAPVAAA